MTVKADLEYLAERYARHPALYRQPSCTQVDQALQARAQLFAISTYQLVGSRWQLAVGSWIFDAGGEGCPALCQTPRPLLPAVLRAGYPGLCFGVSG